MATRRLLGVAAYAITTWLVGASVTWAAGTLEPGAQSEFNLGLVAAGV
jgi:hypothetical protein